MQRSIIDVFSIGTAQLQMLSARTKLDSICKGEHVAPPTKIIMFESFYNKLKNNSKVTSFNIY